MSPEHAWFLDRGEAVLYAVQYDSPQLPACCYIFLNPFDNESDYATRLYVRVARSLTKEHAAAFRFDYSGTGNSFGEFQEVTLSRLFANIQAIRDRALRTFGNMPVYLIGGRYGATLGTAFAGRHPDEVDGLILWDPVLCPEREFRTNFVNKTLLNNKLMGGSPHSRKGIDEALESRGFIELNGILFGQEFYREMTALEFDFPGLASVNYAAVLISSSGADLHAIESLERNGARVEQFMNASHRNPWSMEGFSTSREADFLASMTLSLAREGMRVCKC
jgi:pimeloyl-ACP methyl ester carboxylesterase